MKCPYCRSVDIPLYKRILKSEIRCYNCSNIMVFSELKRFLAVCPFILLTSLHFVTNNVSNKLIMAVCGLVISLLLLISIKPSKIN